jgi:5-methylcytosine-specific restriction endonuclease McrA
MTKKQVRERRCLVCGVDIADRHYRAIYCVGCARKKDRESSGAWAFTERGYALRREAARRFKKRRKAKRDPEKMVACRRCGAEFSWVIRQGSRPKWCRDCAVVKRKEDERRDSKMRSARRRARLRKNGGSYSAREWEELQARYGYRCLACGERKPLTPDHVVPLARKGRNDIGNIQPLCLSCNCSKGTKTIDYRPTSG